MRLVHSAHDSIPHCEWDRARGAPQHPRIQFCYSKGEKAEQVPRATLTLRSEGDAVKHGRETDLDITG